jgi:uncharacterized protein YkwD
MATSVSTLLALALLAACSGAQPPSDGGSSEAPISSSSAKSSPQPGNGAPPQPGNGAPPGDMQTILDAHNRYRASHCAAPLQWSDDIAKIAQAWADKLATTRCGLEHSQSNLGENLAGGTASALTPQRAVDIWYQENKNYDFNHGGFSMTAGHFTQLVWKGSKQLGCGTATCKDTRVWVCNYDPPGNVEGQFPAAVAPATCKK